MISKDRSDGEYGCGREKSEDREAKHDRRGAHSPSSPAGKNTGPVIKRDDVCRTWSKDGTHCVARS